MRAFHSSVDTSVDGSFTQTTVGMVTGDTYYSTTATYCKIISSAIPAVQCSAGYCAIPSVDTEYAAMCVWTPEMHASRSSRQGTELHGKRADAV